MNDNAKRLTLLLRWLGVTLLAIALLWVVLKVLERVEVVALILCGAVFVAYVLYPAVRFFQNRGLPRWGAIILVYAIIAGLIVSFVLFAGPQLATQVKNFSADLPGVGAALHGLLLSAHAAVISAIPLSIRQTAANYLNSVSRDLQAAVTAYAGQAVQLLFSAASVVSAVIIIPILSFYILLDADDLVKGFIQLFPLRNQNTVRLVLEDVDQVLGGFIRGQIIVAAFVAVAVGLALLLLGIPYALLIGVFAGVVDMIPYLGGIAGAVPAVVLAFVLHGFVRALLVAGAFVVIYELEGHVVAPNVVSKRVGLTGLLVIVAVLIGAEVGGIAGMFVAVPLAATIRVIWRRLAHPLELSTPGAPAVQQPDASTSGESEKVVIIAKP
jgi:predicted PurR-regulated permease PerM